MSDELRRTIKDLNEVTAANDVLIWELGRQLADMPELLQRIESLTAELDASRLATEVANKTAEYTQQRLDALLAGLASYAAGSPNGENELLHAVMSFEPGSEHRAAMIEQIQLECVLNGHLAAVEQIELRLAEFRKRA